MGLKMGLKGNSLAVALASFVIYVETDREQRMGSYESWWDVPLAETSEMESVQAYHNYAEPKKKERYFL